MALKVYFDLMSQPARAVLLFLKCNNIKYTPVLVDIKKGSHLDDDYKKITPFQRVPAIEDDGFCLTESVAILKYLHAKLRTPDHWRPRDIFIRARIEEYMNWQHLNTRVNAAMLFRTQVIEPVMTGKPVNETKVEHYKSELTKTLDHIENHFLLGGPYLFGLKEPSLADLLCVCELIQPSAAGYDVGVGRPKIQAYMQQVQTFSAPHFDDVHKILYAVRNKFASKGKL